MTIAASPVAAQPVGGYIPATYARAQVTAPLPKASAQGISFVDTPKYSTYEYTFFVEADFGFQRNQTPIYEVWPDSYKFIVPQELT